MTGFQDTWRVRRPFGDIEIELHPASVDAVVRDASLLELRQLVNDFKVREPEARRAVLELYARMRGQAASVSRSEAYGLDTGSLRVDAIGEELLFAGRTGVVVARRREMRTVVVPLDTPSEAVLGPDSSQDLAADTKSWVGLTLVDQTGTPVPNRPYRVINPDGTTVDGLLDSNGAAMLKGLDPGNCQIWCPYVEPHPPTTYAVQQGDHLSGVAESFGFDDYSTVWNDPGNADLQSQRSDPHVLQPGDALTIPEVKAQPAANKPTGAKHPFTIQRSPLKLRLTLLDLSAKPMASAQVTVAGTALTTDGNGLVEATVDKSTTDATLDSGGDEIDLALGGLNPSDDTSDAGYKARLFNMGFLWDPTVDDTDVEMVIALQDFQAQYSLTVSGQLDDATKAQLLQSHGC
jgi:nucleoid-associated protein YgaU